MLKHAYILSILFIFSCDQPHLPKAQPLANGDFARYGDWVVNRDDFVQLLNTLPQDKMPQLGVDVPTWMKDQIQDLVLDHILLDKARQAKYEEEEMFQHGKQEADLYFTLQLFFDKQLKTLSPADNEALLKTAYEKNTALFHHGERRKCYQFFRRAQSEPEKVKAREELTQIRLRILRGESFQTLAQTLSDSESRHRNGYIGWIEKGTLKPGVEKAIFELQEGVPSQPLTTKDGVQLFFIDTIQPAKALSFEEAKPFLLNQVKKEQETRLLNDYFQTLTPPDSMFSIDRQAFANILKKRDLSSRLLKIGPYELSLGQFFTQARRDAKASRGRMTLNMDTLWALYKRIEKNAIVANHIRSNGLINNQDLAEKIAKWADNTLIAKQMQHEFLALAKSDETALQRFYNDNIDQFSQPVQVKINLLQIPIDSKSNKAMAQLEEASKEKGHHLKDLGFDTAYIQELDWESMEQLKKLNPLLPSMLASLEIGDLTPPFHQGNKMGMAELTDRKEAQPTPFKEVLGKVANFYVLKNRAQLYSQLRSELIQLDKLVFNDSAIQSFLAGGVIRDVAPEELEKLLEAKEATL